MKWNRHVAVWLGCAALLGGVVAGCGGGGGGTSEETGATEGAKVIDVKSMDGAKGEVTYCTGKDTPGDKTALVKKFNAENTGVTVKMLEFSTSADNRPLLDRSTNTPRWPIVARKSKSTPSRWTFS